MINIKKNYEGNWTLWNTVTHETAEITAITSYYMGKRVNDGYRIDKSGKSDLADTFPTAKSIATKLLK